MWRSIRHVPALRLLVWHVSPAAGERSEDEAAPEEGEEEEPEKKKKGPRKSNHSASTNVGGEVEHISSDEEEEKQESGRRDGGPADGKRSAAKEAGRSGVWIPNDGVWAANRRSNKLKTPGLTFRGS
ncbi:MAG: hypothetical protein M1823_001623 [Watsoniomyces obsoletus]|nr:MAG: hypothetical protein M1823_001623 [Watsoniomyces obsoletus]